MGRGRTFLAVGVCLWAASAAAHPKGFHKRLKGVVTRQGLELLVSVDLDQSRKALELRRRADKSLDGTISDDEALALKQVLVGQYLRPLKVQVGGHPLTFGAPEAKLSLRGDPRVSDTGMSIVISLKADFPGAWVPGAQLILKDESPDHSHVGLEIQPQLGAEGGVSGELQRAELRAGESFRMTLRP